MVRDGTFREDLWFRLNVFPIHLPPLRQRREDIPSLVQFFIDRKTRELSLPPCAGVNPEELRVLRDDDWPGNVRELQNVVERALIVSQGGALHFPGVSTPAVVAHVAASEAEEGFPNLAVVADRHIRRALEHAHGGRPSDLALIR